MSSFRCCVVHIFFFKNNQRGRELEDSASVRTTYGNSRLLIKCRNIFFWAQTTERESEITCLNSNPPTSCAYCCIVIDQLREHLPFIISILIPRKHLLQYEAIIHEISKTWMNGWLNCLILKMVLRDTSASKNPPNTHQLHICCCSCRQH